MRGFGVLGKSIDNERDMGVAVLNGSGKALVASITDA
jgi:hypothetical protein